MSLGELGKQFVLVSEKAFDKLKFEGFESVDRKIYYTKRKVRNEKAINDYLDGDIRMNILKDDLFVIDIIRKGLKDGDKII